MNFGLLFSPLRGQKMLKTTFEEEIVGYKETATQMWVGFRDSVACLRLWADQREPARLVNL